MRGNCPLCLHSLALHSCYTQCINIRGLANQEAVVLGAVSSINTIKLHPTEASSLSSDTLATKEMGQSTQSPPGLQCMHLPPTHTTASNPLSLDTSFSRHLALLKITSFTPSVNLSDPSHQTHFSKIFSTTSPLTDQQINLKIFKRQVHSIILISLMTSYLKGV